MQNYGEALRQIQSILQANKVQNSNAEALWILEHILQNTKTQIYQNLSQKINKIQSQRIQTIVQQRNTGKPLAYILQSSHFWKQEFFMAEPVFIPRKETELLLEVVLDFIKKNASKNILEIGSGSGALTLSLALEQTLKICGVDISQRAVKLSKKNQKKYQKKLVEKNSNVVFTKKNIIKEQLNFFLNQKKKFDAIISNPPYIAENEKNKVTSFAIEFEDPLALFAPQNGLLFYQIFAHRAANLLKKNGWIALEHGYWQKQKIIDIFTNKGWKLIYAQQDLAGKDRILIFQTSSILVSS